MYLYICNVFKATNRADCLTILNGSRNQANNGVETVALDQHKRFLQASIIVLARTLALKRITDATRPRTYDWTVNIERFFLLNSPSRTQVDSKEVVENGDTATTKVDGHIAWMQMHSEQFKGLTRSSS
jgi:hypothetical protein